MFCMKRIYKDKQKNGPLVSSQERRAADVLLINQLSTGSQPVLNQLSCSSNQFTRGYVCSCFRKTSRLVVFGILVIEKSKSHTGHRTPPRFRSPCSAPPPRPAPPRPAPPRRPAPTPSLAVPRPARPHPWGVQVLDSTSINLMMTIEKYCQTLHFHCDEFCSIVHLNRDHLVTCLCGFDFLSIGRITGLATVNCTVSFQNFMFAFAA